MVVIATAGHVDHGKSTLLRSLTGADPDRWESEKRRGLTIDLGFVHAELAGTAGDPVTIAFVDVPGHRRFVSNMLAGVGPVPAVLFVVAADDGWMPQSQEHLDALAALGVSHGVLAITRSDLMEPGLALAEAREAMAGTPLADIPAVAVSAVTGEGLPRLREMLAALAADLPAPDPDADVRLWVDRSFTIGGAGTVVTGTLAGGTVRVGDVIEVGVGGSRATVRGMQSLGADVQAASGPARVALNLRGVSTGDVSRGTPLLTPRHWRGTRLADVRLLPVGAPCVGTAPESAVSCGADPDGAAPDHAGAGRLPERMTAHLGSAAVPVHVRPLRSPPDGETRWARLTLDGPLPLRLGDRLILRVPGAHRIPAGAVVMDPAPPSLTRRGDARRRAEVLDGLELVAAPGGRTGGGLVDGTGVPSLASELARSGWAHIDDLRAMGTPGVPARTRWAGWLIDEARADGLASGIAEMVAEADRRDPLEPGMAAGEALRRLSLPDPALLKAVLARPAAAGLSESGGRILRKDTPPPDGESALPASVRQAAETLGERLAAAPFVAPTAGELAELGLGRRELAACVRAGLLEQVGAGVWLGPDGVEQAVEVLRGLAQPFTPSEAREALGTSRRVVMPLLELLESRGVTRRVGEAGHKVVRPGGGRRGRV